MPFPLLPEPQGSHHRQHAETPHPLSSGTVQSVGDLEDPLLLRSSQAWMTENDGSWGSLVGSQPEQRACQTSSNTTWEHRTNAQP